MNSLFARFVKDESGATAIEYGLIAAFISLVIVATGPTIKANLGAVFGDISAKLATAVPAS